MVTEAELYHAGEAKRREFSQARATLNRDDLYTLLVGGVVQVPGTNIILSDMGFELIRKTLNLAERDCAEAACET